MKLTDLDQKALRRIFSEIGGIEIQYAATCPRELWLHQHYVQLEAEILRIGKSLEELLDFEEGYEEKRIDRIAIDGIERRRPKGIIIEIKKSRKSRKQAFWQLAYYLFYIELITGETLEGEIVYPNGRRERVILNDGIRKRILELAELVLEMRKRKNPPKPVKIPYCHRCSYRDLCWLEGER